ncbi:MAG: hypothetical protein QG559_1556 [Campylobacterota bacterium]|nr:hypothetical protein [Campylobacterota bacterium]
MTKYLQNKIDNIGTMGAMELVAFKKQVILSALEPIQIFDLVNQIENRLVTLDLANALAVYDDTVEVES